MYMIHYKPALQTEDKNDTSGTVKFPCKKEKESIGKIERIYTYGSPSKANEWTPSLQSLSGESYGIHDIVELLCHIHYCVKFLQIFRSL